MLFDARYVHVSPLSHRCSQEMPNLVQSRHQFVIYLLMDFIIEVRARRLSEWHRELQITPFRRWRMKIRRSTTSHGVKSSRWRRRRAFSCREGAGKNLLNWKSSSFPDLRWMTYIRSIYDVRWIRSLFHDIRNYYLRNSSMGPAYKSPA